MNGIQDKRFVNQSALYGSDLVNFAFRQQAVNQATLQMVY
jgi:hypothetical protein